MRQVITHGEYIAMQARGEVTAHFAAETVRAEYPVEVAEFSSPPFVARPFFTPDGYPVRAHEPYEDAVFSEDEEDGGPEVYPRWYLDQQDRITHDVARSSTMHDLVAVYPPEAISEAIDVMAAMPWSACE